jgi:hypothetical protein
MINRYDNPKIKTEVLTANYFALPEKAVQKGSGENQK